MNQPIPHQSPQQQPQQPQQQQSQQLHPGHQNGIARAYNPSRGRGRGGYNSNRSYANPAMGHQGNYGTKMNYQNRQFNQNGTRTYVPNMQLTNPNLSFPPPPPQLTTATQPQFSIPSAPYVEESNAQCNVGLLPSPSNPVQMIPNWQSGGVGNPTVLHSPLDNQSPIEIPVCSPTENNFTPMSYSPSQMQPMPPMPNNSFYPYMPPQAPFYIPNNFYSPIPNYGFMPPFLSGNFAPAYGPSGSFYAMPPPQLCSQCGKNPIAEYLDMATMTDRVGTDQ